MDRHIEIAAVKTPSNYAEIKKNRRDGSLYQILMCTLANMSTLGPSMGFGYSAVALPTLTSNSTAEFTVNNEQASWIASAFAIGCPVGCIICSFILQRGRKFSLLMTSGVSLIGWMIIYLSESYSQLLIGRTVSGIAMGLASVPATVYSAEVAGPELRGTTLTWTSITIAIGVLLVYIFGYIFPSNWRLVALLSALAPLISFFVTMITLPESPTWLRQHGRLDEAEKVLKKFRGIPENAPVPEELQPELRPIPRQMKKRHDLLKNLLSRSALEPLTLMLIFFFFQQFAGIFSVVYYAVDMTQDAGLKIDGYLGAVLIGFTRLIGSILAASISNKFGRKIPSIVSGAGMTIFMLALAIYVYFKDSGHVIHDSGIIPATCVLMFIFMSTVGFLVVPFAMVGEIYPASVKDVLSGFTTSVAYAFSFVTVKTYPEMLSLMGGYGVFLFYGIISLFGTIFVILFLPETKNKSLAEIQELFENRKKKSLLQAKNGSAIEDVIIEKEMLTPLKEIITGSINNDTR